ncbi:hypothetical protein [Jeotgalibacillus campisalis]|uniref:Uncharacterized protein n=1 Tax=Jeotgalibacillus campisalis TaxID=220754 RepID=A0A0C2W555_9BACL|nr:hypothetical protein [Jeotgalibacillus campisalis]KIL51148.1 hypothetical protein KR50_10290 [Jeotgalibacillus campisalis]
MKNSRYGVHEIVDLRELLNFNWSCLSEAKQRVQVIKDEDLKKLAEESILQLTVSIDKMNEFISASATRMTQ